MSNFLHNRGIYKCVFQTYLANFLCFIHYAIFVFLSDLQKLNKNFIVVKEINKIISTQKSKQAALSDRAELKQSKQQRQS